MFAWRNSGRANISAAQVHVDKTGCKIKNDVHRIGIKLKETLNNDFHLYLSDISNSVNSFKVRSI